MLRVTLAGLRARVTRTVMISLAIALAVAFVSATFSLTDALRASLYKQVAAQTEHLAVHVTANNDAPLPPGQTESGLTDQDVRAVRALPGVAAAHPTQSHTVKVLKADGTPVSLFGSPEVIGTSLPADVRLYEDEVGLGSYPARPGEVLISEDVAKKAGWGPGDTARVADPAGVVRPMRVTGIMDGGFQDIGLLPPDFRAATKNKTWATIEVVAAPGAGQAELRDRVAAALGKDATAVTGTAFADELANNAIGDLKVFTQGLLLFAGIALVVAAIVIYNAFTVLIAQRQRELALLRCVGARRGQIFRGVVLEAGVLGLLASAFGYLLGYALAAAGLLGLQALADDFAGETSVVFSSTAAVAALLVGLSVTVLSALLPARAATRIAPVRALNSSPELGESARASKRRLIIAAAFMVAGAGAVYHGARSQSVAPAFAGGLLVLIGLIVLGPIAVGPVTQRIGRVPALVFGPVGVLAAANGRRNPRRTSAAVMALTLGVTLVSLFLVGAESGRASATKQINDDFPVDFVVETYDDKGLPVGLAGRLRELPEVAEVAVQHEGARGTLGGGNETNLSGIDTAVLSRDPGAKVLAGSLRDLRSGTAVVYSDTAEQAGVQPGGTLEVRGAKGSRTVRVAAVVKLTGRPNDGVALTRADYAKVASAAGPKDVFVWTKDGVSAETAADAVAKITDTVPTATVTDTEKQKEELSRMIDTLLAVVGALILLSIVIAVVGIAITLSLSVVERTREAGMLRAVGLTRRQLRSTLLLEAVIMAVAAAVLGIGLGTGFGVAGLYALVPHDELVLALPWDRMAILVAGAALAGIAAAVLPARRAVKVSPVAALAAD